MELKINIELTPDDAESLMRDPEFAAAIETIQRRNAYPRRWGKSTRHKYEQRSADNGWKEDVWVELPKDLAYKICPDCGTHVRIRVGDQEFHLSMRLSDFVNLTPNLQVKPERSVLLVRRLRSFPGARHCQAAAD